MKFALLEPSLERVRSYKLGDAAVHVDVRYLKATIIGLSIATEYAAGPITLLIPILKHCHCHKS